MEYLPPELPNASGWLTMRYLMQSLEEQFKTAPQQLALAPEMMPHLFQQAEQLLCNAHAVPVSGMPAAHGDAGPTTSWHVLEMDAAGRVVYPTLLNVKTIAWPEGVGPGKVLEQKHDIDLLHLQGNRATQFVVIDWRMMMSTSIQVSEMNVT